MAETLRNPFTHRLAWANYRSRVAATLSFLGEKLEDAEDNLVRSRIASLIERNTAYLRQAEQRLAELSGDGIAAN